MNLSPTGLDFIVSFEGKLKLLPDGRYIAYRCPANVLTIYAGCTEGVTEGMIVTEDEGKAMFRRELAKHEAAVRRLVTVDLTQNQFDSLTSFSFNVGTGALQNSTLLKHLNKGDYARAASHFADFKKAGGKVLKGLVRRRAAEAAMFMDDGEPVGMVQKVDKPDTKMKLAEVVNKVVLPTGVVAGGGATVATKTAAPVAVPVIKPTTKEQLAKAKDTAKEVREHVEVAKDYYSWAKPTAMAAYDNWMVVGPLVLVAGAAIFWPKLREKLPW